MNHYLILVLMMLVTYIPRLFPFLALDEKKIPPAVKQWLGWLPYAALGALIIPGGLSAIEGPWWISPLGLFIAAGISWFYSNMIVTVLCTLAILYFIPIG
ncbi:MAG: AzlD domain-containing protein [Spirochaetales bacterium]|nr:AzlD domain-containing protein [Spirochaetales bacterium]